MPDAPLTDLLPEDLRARCVPSTEPAAPDGRELVVVWLRGALRATSNPAIEVGIHLAKGLDLPILVYQALDERHPYASDRVWTFALEGTRDLAQGLGRRGLRHAFHLARREAPAGRALLALARRAAAVVCDEHPVQPVRSWTDALEASGAAPLIRVDASCVVPMHASEEAHERAFAFKKATRKARKRWLGWEPEDAPAPARFAGDLPFTALDLGTADIPALVAGCDIDHGIGPVAHTRGGTAAGEARWAAFVESGLAGYARRRNDPLADGVSRMSAYLHFGMVSPFRIAADCVRVGGKGPEKYLDELLVWREVAWHFCFHTPDVDSAAALPAWARETLAEHESDPRDGLYSWARLAGAGTGDELWDAMQRSLLRHGELHNNLRMTWGKAVAGWTPNADGALAHLVDLNHRYALDGRDPSSYGGILWCLGQFDRPFAPEAPVLGSVRPRSTHIHAERIDVTTYSQQTSAPNTGSVQRIAIVGAGMAGLSAAQALAEAGHAPVLFDKARGVGGRTSLRRADPFAFDHGAQYFTARDPRFRRHVDAWVEEGVCAPWKGRLAVIDRPGSPETRPESEPRTERFVGTPGMNAMAKRLADGADVRVRSRVTALARGADGWTLTFEDGATEAGFDLVLVTTPPAQAAPLVAASPTLVAAAESVEMEPCWAAMLAFDSPYGVPFDGAFVNDGPLSWVARNSSKPGRPAGSDAWVLHGSKAWTQANLELSPDDAAAALGDALAAASGTPLPPILHAKAHRWMYSGAIPPREDGALFDAEVGLGLAGDWLNGAKVQGAWLSGRALAGHVLGELARP